jgi:hypothetical protein
MPEWSSRYPKTAKGARIGEADIGVRREVFVVPIDPQRPLVDQLLPAVPAAWPVVGPDDRQVGRILIYWRGGSWRAGNMYRDDPGDSRPTTESVRAEKLLERALGGTLDTTATVRGPFGSWLLGRRADRGAGVFFDPDLLMYNDAVPELMRVYDDAGLIKWLQLN